MFINFFLYINSVKKHAGFNGVRPVALLLIVLKIFPKS